MRSSSSQRWAIDYFGRGLLRAAGVTGNTLNLSQKVGGHRPTVQRVVVELNAVLKKLVLNFNNINDEGTIAIAESLKTNSTLEDRWISTSAASDQLVVRR